MAEKVPLCLIPCFFRLRKVGAQAPAPSHAARYCSPPISGAGSQCRPGLGVERTLSACMGGPYCSLSQKPLETLSSDTPARRRPDRRRPPQVGAAAHTCTESADRTEPAKHSAIRSLPTSTQAGLRKTHCTACEACTTGMAFNGGSESRLLMPVGATV